MPSFFFKTARVARIITLFILFLLLLAPVFKWYQIQIQKPIIVFAVDQSKSIALPNDAAKQITLLKNTLPKLKSALANDYEVQMLSFGSKVRPFDSLTFHDNQTNISSVLQQIQNQYEYQNLGAVVLISDGIINNGQNPLYMPQPLTFPVYSVVMGDTTLRRDIFIEKLIYNQHAYLGNNIRIQVNVKANLANGERTHIHLLENNKVLDTREISIQNKQYFQSVFFTVEAQQAGIHTYTMVIDSLPHEYTTKNNKAIAVIHVTTDKQKVIIASNAPHPDVGALRYALETNTALDVNVLSPDAAADSLAKANCIILYQLPSVANAASTLLKKIMTAQIPTLFVLGGQTQFTQLNQLFPSPILVTNSKQTEDAFPVINKTENIFNISDNEIKTYEDYPPLLVPFADYKLPAGAEIVAYQRIKQITTSKPLIAFTSWQSNQKCGIIFGEGLYRWRLNEFEQTQQHIQFNTFINKLVSYLMTKQKKEYFVVNAKPVFSEIENIEFQAELYNKSYEPVSTSDIQLSVTSDKNKTFTFTFDKNSPYYSLNAGTFPVGEFKWTATTNIGNDFFKKTGAFTVHEENIEIQNLTANYSLMEQLALRTKGEIIPLSQLESLSQKLKVNQNIVTTSSSQENFVSLIEFKWILILLALLLGIEWFLRRFFGSL